VYHRHPAHWAQLFDQFHKAVQSPFPVSGPLHGVGLAFMEPKYWFHVQNRAQESLGLAYSATFLEEFQGV
jgi:hypothetical protein